MIPVGLIRALFSPIIERIEALEARPVGVIDAGVWIEGTVYPKDAGTTWDGHYWIAQTQTSEQPGVSSAWRMAVRRGKQGREGKPGPPCRCAERAGGEARR
jgi:collagen type III alpha